MTSQSRVAARTAAVSAFLADGAEGTVTGRIVDGDRRLPPSTPDEWGALDKQVAASAQDVAQRLAAEERSPGFAPW